MTANCYYRFVAGVGAALAFVSAAFAADEPAPTSLRALDRPAANGLDLRATLPAECGGGLLPALWTDRVAALNDCVADLTARTKVETAVTALTKSRLGDSQTIALPDPAASVAALKSARPGERIEIRDYGLGVGVEAKRPPLERAVPIPASGQADIPQIASLNEIELVGGGCAEAGCIAVFRVAGKTYPVRKVGDYLAANVVLTKIDRQASGIAVTVQYSPVGGKPQRQEFRL